MSTMFITGATGFLGSYVCEVLLRETDHQLAVLTRAKNREEGVAKLWKSLQMHMDAERFWSVIDRFEIITGDLTGDKLGMSDDDYEYVTKNAESVLHIAASLNRKSAKACLNNNLRGTLSVIKLAKAIDEDHGLRRFSHVSTVAVCGHRDREVVLEDESIDWNRSDYDPYGRTKKFCEHMVRELLPDVQKTFFRPSIVMGDSRMPETTQFDMVRAFCTLADLPVVPFDGNVRVDIVNANWVGHAIATLHVKDKPDHMIYHLSSGTMSRTAKEVARAIGRATGRNARFVPQLEGPFASAMNGLAGMRAKNTLTLVGSLFKVFLPYITYDTVFDNTRAVTELGVAPTPFPEYCTDLHRFAKGVGYKYPYKPLPKKPASAQKEIYA